MLLIKEIAAAYGLSQSAAYASQWRSYWWIEL